MNSESYKTRRALVALIALTFFGILNLIVYAFNLRSVYPTIDQFTLSPSPLVFSDNYFFTDQSLVFSYSDGSRSEISSWKDFPKLNFGPFSRYRILYLISTRPNHYSESLRLRMGQIAFCKLHFLESIHQGRKLSEVQMRFEKFNNILESPSTYIWKCP